MNRTVKPFANQGNYTVFDNYVLDYIMPRVSPNAWKCLSFIIRKTVGWHKESDDLSFSQIRGGTGIGSDPTVHKALKQLEQDGYIIVQRPEDPWASNIYSLNTALEIIVEEAPTIETIVGSTIETIADTTIETIVGSTIETIDTKQREKHIKQTKNKEGASLSQKMFSALADLCQYDLSIISDKERGQLNQAEKKMRENGYTPADLKAFGEWWFANYWKGQKGETPTLTDVRQTWGQFKNRGQQNGQHHQNNVNGMSAGQAGSDAGRQPLSEASRRIVEALKAKSGRDS